MKREDRNKTSKKKRKKKKKKKWNGTTTKQGTKFNGGIDTKKNRTINRTWKIEKWGWHKRKIGSLEETEQTKREKKAE